ncbi:hypothetical protein ACHQM5_001629 [Ranunculus cassubicifolius]
MRHFEHCAQKRFVPDWRLDGCSIRVDDEYYSFLMIGALYTLESRGLARGPCVVGDQCGVRMRNQSTKFLIMGVLGITLIPRFEDHVFLIF